jgi:hypothetical protein
MSKLKRGKNPVENGGNTEKGRKMVGKMVEKWSIGRGVSQ